MDDFISMVRNSIKRLGSSPVLLLAGFAVGVLSLSGLIGYGGFDEVSKAIAADYSLLLLPLLIMPFFTGGALGYAAEARKNGSSSLSTFISAGVNNYVRMLMAAVIALVAFYFFTLGAGLFLLVGGMGDPIIGSILGSLTLALAFLCLMAIEFYDVSIVAEGSGVVAAFRNSIDFVKRNLLAASGFFLIVLFLKFLLQAPLSFGLAGAMMANRTYYNALVNASNASNSTALNVTSLLGMEPVTLGMGGLVTVGMFQVILQGFVFAFLALYKTEFYLAMKARKKITDFDYDFSQEPQP